MVMSLVIMLSQGGVSLGTGLGAPGFLNVNLILALLSAIVLFSAAAKALSVDSAIASGAPGSRHSSPTVVRAGTPKVSPGLTYQRRVGNRRKVRGRGRRPGGIRSNRTARTPRTVWWSVLRYQLPAFGNPLV